MFFILLFGKWLLPPLGIPLIVLLLKRHEIEQQLAFLLMGFVICLGLTVFAIPIVFTYLGKALQAMGVPNPLASSYFSVITFIFKILSSIIALVSLANLFKKKVVPNAS